MLFPILICEIFIISALIYKYKIVNVISIGVLFFFIYGQSFYIDYLLFNQEYLHPDYIHIFSNEYLYIALMYFIFILSYSMYPLLTHRYNKMDVRFISAKDYKLFNVMVFISLLAIVYFLYSTYGLDRYGKIDWFQSHKPLTLFLNVVGYMWIITFFRKEFISTSKLNILFTLLFILYAFTSGGRELIVIILLAILFYKFDKVNSLVLILIGCLFLFLLSIWKGFYFFVIMRDLDITGFLDWMDSYYRFSISRIEPASSIYLMYNYFMPEHQEFFNRFNLTYVENIVGQVLRTFRLESYSSIGEQIAEYFLNTTQKGKGLAFSGILESIFNFAYLGPAILGFILGYLAKKIDNLRSSDLYLYKVLSLFFLVIMMKLTRTELAVVLKIYFLPMLIAYLIMYKFLYYKKVEHG